jgi:hypothetical protein
LQEHAGARAGHGGLCRRTCSTCSSRWCLQMLGFSWTGRAVAERGESWKPGKDNGHGNRERGRDGAHICSDSPFRAASTMHPVQAAEAFRHHPRGCCRALRPLDRRIRASTMETFKMDARLIFPDVVLDSRPILGYLLASAQDEALGAPSRFLQETVQRTARTRRKQILFSVSVSSSRWRIQTLSYFFFFRVFS